MNTTPRAPEHQHALDALGAAIASLRDLNNDWPKRELHEPITETLLRGARVLSDAGVSDFDDLLAEPLPLTDEQRLQTIASCGYRVYDINGGVFLKAAQYAVADPDDDADGYYLEANSIAEFYEEMSNTVLADTASTS